MTRKANPLRWKLSETQPPVEATFQIPNDAADEWLDLDGFADVTFCVEVRDPAPTKPRPHTRARKERQRR